MESLDSEEMIKTHLIESAELFEENNKVLSDPEQCSFPPTSTTLHHKMSYLMNHLINSTADPMAAINDILENDNTKSSKSKLFSFNSDMVKKMQEKKEEIRKSLLNSKKKRTRSEFESESKELVPVIETGTVANLPSTNSSLTTSLTSESPAKKAINTVALYADTKIGSSGSKDQSLALMEKRRRLENSDFFTPKWHAPWKLKTVISGHSGWVTCVDVDVTNEWFVTGSNDRTLKFWNLATGGLKLTLTGHASEIKTLKISERSPYLFSAGLDREIKCWDLEKNKVIKSFHGHNSGIMSIDLHPSLDIVVSGGRDSAVYVWDVRTSKSIFTLSGHNGTIFSVICQANEPQIVSGSADNDIKLWDLKAGKAITTLTNHKNSVRSLTFNQANEFTFASASTNSIKKWKCPNGEFIQNLYAKESKIPGGQVGVINCMRANADNVLVTGSNTGMLHFWDWATGFNFASHQSQAQPGSIPGSTAETAILGCCFDRSGTRLITTEADKTVKIWKEDENATPETNPLDMVEVQNQLRGVDKKY